MTTPPPAPADASGRGGQPSAPDSGRPVVMWAAVGILALFAVLVVYMLSKAQSSSEIHWSRMVFLYGGVEAVVFAAGGALFGRQVERAKSQAAEQRADKAEKAASAAQGDAEAGRALRAAVQAEADTAAETSADPAQPAAASRPAPGLTSERVGSSGAAAAAAQFAGGDVPLALRRLTRLGDRLFDHPAAPPR